MAGSIDRVTRAAADAGLDIEIRRVGASTRTAQRRLSWRRWQSESNAPDAQPRGCSEPPGALLFGGDGGGRQHDFGRRRREQHLYDVAEGEDLAFEDTRVAEPPRHDDAAIDHTGEHDGDVVEVHAF